ncbi:MAG: hypothetical protein ACKVX7_02385 [Planctomycetota bacterium]
MQVRTDHHWQSARKFRAPALVFAKRLLIWMFASLLVVASPKSSARADIFELDDGRRLEGSVIREINDLVSIKTVTGEIVTVDKKAILKRQRSVTVLDEYQERLKSLKSEDWASQFELAVWCEKSGLKDYQIRHLREVIRLRPNHEKAREGLGYELILGDWYLKGSPEANEKLKELEQPLTEAPKEITPSRVRSRPKDEDTQPAAPLPADAESVRIEIDELVDRAAPTPSLATAHLTRFLQGLKKPMRVVGGAGTERTDGLYLRARVRVFFVRTHMYYKKLPISNVFKGEVELVLEEVKGGETRTILDIGKMSAPFSASVQNTKEEAFDYAYYDIVQRLMAKLSIHPYFKERGATPLPQPE